MLAVTEINTVIINLKIRLEIVFNNIVLIKKSRKLCHF